MYCIAIEWKVRVLSVLVGQQWNLGAIMILFVAIRKMRVEMLSDAQSGINDNEEIKGDNEVKLNYSATGNDSEKTRSEMNGQANGESNSAQLAMTETNMKNIA